MADRKAPVVTAQMLIRRPVDKVFEAFVDPAITTQFWFTKSSGRLEAGKTIQWNWEMYGASTLVQAKIVEPNKRILVEWDDPPCPVEWIFESRAGDATLVTISNWGFRGNKAEVCNQAIDSMGGFTLVLAGLKALLEHNVKLNLIADHHPDAARLQQDS